MAQVWFDGIVAPLTLRDAETPEKSPPGELQALPECDRLFQVTSPPVAAMPDPPPSAAVPSLSSGLLVPSVKLAVSRRTSSVVAVTCPRLRFSRRVTLVIVDPAGTLQPPEPTLNLNTARRGEVPVVVDTQRSSSAPAPKVGLFWNIVPSATGLHCPVRIACRFTPIFGGSGRFLSVSGGSPEQPSPRRATARVARIRFIGSHPIPPKHKQTRCLSLARGRAPYGLPRQSSYFEFGCRRPGASTEVANLEKRYYSGFSGRKSA